MCMGQYSVLDPRCVNWSQRDSELVCFWCNADLQRVDWYTKEASLEHAEDCPMRTQWEVEE